jgi:hypothetical protein
MFGRDVDGGTSASGANFAIFLVACQVLTFGIIRIGEAMSLI